MKRIADSRPSSSVRLAVREGIQLIEVNSYVRSIVSSNRTKSPYPSESHNPSGVFVWVGIGGSPDIHSENEISVAEMSVIGRTNGKNSSTCARLTSRFSFKNE